MITKTLCNSNDAGFYFKPINSWIEKTEVTSSGELAAFLQPVTLLHCARVLGTAPPQGGKPATQQVLSNLVHLPRNV